MINYPISVFIDTNIFDECKYHLEDTSVLKILRKFADDKKIRLYTSNIVLGEVEKHIKDNVSSTYDVLKKQIKEMRKFISPSILVDTPIRPYFDLPLNDGLEDAAFAKFYEYICEVGFTVLDNSGVDVNKIVDDYFHCRPPFEDNVKKKSEFPDAIMISKLKEEFGKDNCVWIVSGDNGFQRAFVGLEGFNCLGKLKDLFDIINEQDEKAIYDAIKFHLLNDVVLENIEMKIKEKISDGAFEIDGMDCDRKGFCEGFDYDEAFIESISNLSVGLSSVNEVGENTVSVTIECRADISVLCSYDDLDNAAWNSEEKEYIYLERGKVSEDHSVEFESELEFSISSRANDFTFQLEKIELYLELNQWTRTTREEIVNDSRSEAEAEMMDTLEEYYKH